MIFLSTLSPLHLLSVRVLTGKSCAFVTYKTEASAQFAKEAMTCQSLDHNEILNVRWSTQDPNPSAIKREREEMIRIGQKKIEENLTEEMKEAGMLLNQLENQNQDQDQDQDEEGEEEGEGTKRKRLKFNGNEEEVEDEELKKLIEENKRGWKEIEREEDERLKLERKLEEEKERKRIVMNSGGFLSNDALIGLQSLGSIRRNNGKEKEKLEMKNGGGNGLMALNGYGSESEDEED